MNAEKMKTSIPAQSPLRSSSDRSNSTVSTTIWSVSIGKPAGKQRKKLDAETKKKVAGVRKRGACNTCRRKKVACNHSTTSNVSTFLAAIDSAAPKTPYLQDYEQGTNSVSFPRYTGLQSKVPAPGTAWTDNNDILAKLWASKFRRLLALLPRHHFLNAIPFDAVAINHQTTMIYSCGCECEPGVPTGSKSWTRAMRLWWRCCKSLRKSFWSS